MAKQKFYAYFIPETMERGVADNWAECERKVKGVEGARFKGFTTYEAASEWLRKGADYSKKEAVPPGIYFDAGTGRGHGVEVSVTDETGKNLLHHALAKSKTNKYGKLLLTEGYTNNYGELLGFIYAVKIALKLGIKNIRGDSALVVNHWSRGVVRFKLVPGETAELSKNAAKLRKKFESQGGKVELISGDINPADLGFH